MLNEYFDSWATSGPTYRIPVTYNMLPSTIYRLVLIFLCVHISKSVFLTWQIFVVMHQQLENMEVIYLWYGFQKMKDLESGCGSRTAGYSPEVLLRQAM